jgi:hypothetical protein
MLAGLLLLCCVCRWHVQMNMFQLLQQQHWAASYFKPAVEVRCLTNWNVLKPAARVDGSGVLHEARPQKPERQQDDLEVIVQFATFAEATSLSSQLLMIVKQLLLMPYIS